MVLDFVAEQGAEKRGLGDDPRRRFVLRHRLRRRAHIPTLDIVSTERNVIGNIVGTYNDLAELMVLAQAGKVTLHTKTYPLDVGAGGAARPRRRPGAGPGHPRALSGRG